jgi:hypothetical protein
MVTGELVFINDSMWQSQLSFELRFLGQPWIRFHMSVVTQFSMTIDRSIVTQVSLMISGSIGTQFLLRNPFVNNGFVFPIDFMSQLWTSFHCRFHTSVVTQFSTTIDRSTVTQVSLMISGSLVTQFSLMIPCVNDESVFASDFKSQRWISFCCRFHT